MSDELDRLRLAKILGLLGSAHDGEVVNAARVADDMVKAADMTWPEALGIKDIASVPVVRGNFSDSVDDILDLGTLLGILTEWEIGFLKSIRYWRGDLTSRQQEVLDRLRTKVADEARP